MDRYPFAYNHSQPFMQQAGEWIADLLYDVLPKHGFEVRDEQIYMAFQLERAFAGKRTIFAEAGVGTGKTLVYLLYSICYARYRRKPVIIACADESLIEQLVKPEGDIAKLQNVLGLSIDVRLAKSPDQYVCLNKLDEARLGHEEAELYRRVYADLPEFVHVRDGMQSFHAYGDRKQYPHMTDEQWNRMSWDVFQDCFACDRRHRCGQTLSRDYCRRAADLVICSHDFYMEHVWTYESRRRKGQLPMLPEHCAVVFDEGHLLEAAAQKALTYKLKHVVFEELITRLLKGEIRESLAYLIEDAISQSEALFELLEGRSRAIPGSDRKRIELDESLLEEIRKFRDVLTVIEDELVYESELFTINEYQLRIVEEHLEMMQKALMLFQQPEKLICWATESVNGLSLVMMPRTVQEVMRERVLSAGIPIVFSSATLSVDGSFDYVADSLGISNYLSFSVPSPYEYKRQMKVIAPKWSYKGTFSEKMKTAVRLLQLSEGRALILFPGKEELHRFKREIAFYPECAAMRFLFEGDMEISRLIAAFQHDEPSILCAVTLWEGLDVPGPSLSNVTIWSLPFPPQQDPVFTAKRQTSASPYEEVDLPYMLLRLKQGIGRLIRSRDDCGLAAILSEELPEQPQLREHIEKLLPEGVELLNRLGETAEHK